MSPPSPVVAPPLASRDEEPAPISTSISPDLIAAAVAEVERSEEPHPAPADLPAAPPLFTAPKPLGDASAPAPLIPPRPLGAPAERTMPAPLHQPPAPLHQPPAPLHQPPAPL
ncbi:MAG TPA: hypothetical protein VM841_04630, partial [Actinomycetota bacterium]|nr:hypothetical protein [Actinomycetota bacterium]